MKIGVAQINCSPGEVPENCFKIESFSRLAREQGCEMVVFPEMTDTGYDISLIPEKASTWSELPFATLKNTASELGIYLVCGISEKVCSDIYNSIAVLDPKGDLVFKYRKTHLFSPHPVCEDRYFLPGNSLETVIIDDMIWGFSICFDLRFPEVSRSLMLKGAGVLVVCSAWPSTRSEHWTALTTARAIENQAYVVASNRIGTDGALNFCGSSCIIDPFGVALASCDEKSEKLITGEVNKDRISSVRRMIPVRSSRREELY